MTFSPVIKKKYVEYVDSKLLQNLMRNKGIPNLELMEKTNWKKWTISYILQGFFMFLYTTDQMIITGIVSFAHIKAVVLICHAIFQLISKNFIMQYFSYFTIRGLFKKKGEFSNFVGYVHSIFDFPPPLYWHTSPECIFTVSAI